MMLQDIALVSIATALLTGVLLALAVRPHAQSETVNHSELGLGGSSPRPLGRATSESSKFRRVAVDPHVTLPVHVWSHDEADSEVVTGIVVESEDVSSCRRLRLVSNGYVAGVPEPQAALDIVA